MIAATYQKSTQTFPIEVANISKRTRVRINLVENAVKSYVTHGVHRSVLDRLTLPFDVGSCIALMGPNGCGKSTLIGSIAGVNSLDSGRCGLTLTQADLIAVIFQEYRKQLAGCEERNSYVSVLQNVLLPIGGGRAIGYQSSAVIAEFSELLKQIGYEIDLRQPVGRLSGGQQQAVCLARALAYHPTTLIWDEPTSAIDFGKRGLIYKLIASKRAAREMSLVLVTHDIEEAILLGDRIVLFDSNMNILEDVDVPQIGDRSDLQFLDSPEAMQVRRRVRSAMLGTMWRE